MPIMEHLMSRNKSLAGVTQYKTSPPGQNEIYEKLNCLKNFIYQNIFAEMANSFGQFWPVSWSSSHASNFPGIPRSVDHPLLP